MLVIDPVYTIKPAYNIVSKRVIDYFVDVTITAPLGWWDELFEADCYKEHGRHFGQYNDILIGTAIHEAAMRNNGKLVVSNFNDEAHDDAFYERLKNINEIIDILLEFDVDPKIWCVTNIFDNQKLAVLCKSNNWIDDSFMLKNSFNVPLSKLSDKVFRIDACDSKYPDEWDILSDFVSRLPKQH